MKKIIILILLFFVYLILLPKITYAQTAQTSQCPNAIIGTCTEIPPTQCGDRMCSCKYSGASNGTPCTYDQDQRCPGESLELCPRGSTTPLETCINPLPNRNCPAVSPQPIVNTDGSRTSYGPLINCWTDRSHSSCTGLDKNGCGFCQGWFMCKCVNGQPTEVACDRNNPIEVDEGCGRETSCSASTCPTPPPVYTCTGNDSDGQPLSCQNGNACPSEYEPASDTSKNCAPNSVCCSHRT